MTKLLWPSGWCCRGQAPTVSPTRLSELVEGGYIERADAGVRLLGDIELVDGERISLLGFSVGASTALVGASDPTVAGAVHA
jgi:dienelactone hydrolase